MTHDPDSNGSEPPPSSSSRSSVDAPKANIVERFKAFLHNNHKRPASDTALRDAIEEYIEEPGDRTLDPVSQHERALFSNILKLRDIPVYKVMVPRADIVAIDVETGPEELFALLAEKQYSRIPVYQGTLDDVLGTIHLKDIIEMLVQKREIVIRDLLTDIPIVSPSMSIPDLLMTMRDSRRHMVMVVDEYGGIDGLVTIGDVIETIVGEIDDEHDLEEDAPHMTDAPDGSVLMDARVYLEDFEDQYGGVFTDEEREESETMGGLAFMLAGRVPVRGEVLVHNESGVVFEILDADRRRVKRLKLSNLPLRDPDAP